MKLTPQDIRHVAELARLEVSGADVELYLRELGSILDYVAKLGELPTDGVPPTAGVGVEHLPLRPDEVREQLPREEALRNAPDVRNDHFRVPRVVE